MLPPDDTSLAARPEQFELVPGAPARFFRMLAVVDSVLFVALALAAFTLWEEWVLGVVAVALALVAPATLLWLARRVRVWRLCDGRPLGNRVVLIDADPDEAFERLSTGDPSIDTPIATGSAPSGPTVRVFSDHAAAVSYVVVSRSGKGATLDVSPIIELRGERHAALQAALSRGLGRSAA